MAQVPLQWFDGSRTEGNRGRRTSLGHFSQSYVSVSGCKDVGDVIVVRKLPPLPLPLGGATSHDHHVYDVCG
jgi:hypothetical protein